MALIRLFISLIPLFRSVYSQASGTGTTTRYWDCCKASCGWTGKATLASGSNPVISCDANNNPLTNFNTASYCAATGGSAYMCASQSPWAVSDTLSYGFAAVNIQGGTEASWCCACYQLTFTSGAVAGKQMIVQATNTGGDLNGNQFDLAMPGGGFGIYNACSNEYGTPAGGWGAQYGGVSSRSQCDSFPAVLQPGCDWRFDWFQGADNPTVSFKQVACPAALTAKTGCVRANDAIDETPTGSSVVATWTSSAGGSTSTSAGGGGGTTTTSSAGGSGTGAAVGHYGQCGGTGYTGSTACASPYTCTYSNEYYSQCL